MEWLATRNTWDVEDEMERDVGGGEGFLSSRSRAESPRPPKSGMVEGMPANTACRPKGSAEEFSCGFSLFDAVAPTAELWTLWKTRGSLAWSSPSLSKTLEQSSIATLGARYGITGGVSVNESEHGGGERTRRLRQKL